MRKFEGRLMDRVREFNDIVNEYYSKMEKDRDVLIEKLSEIPKFEIKNEGKWYLEVLNGLRVVGVDGSQITPLKEVGIPIGGIQIAKLSIIHGTGSYDLKYYSAFVGMEENVSLARFKMEVEALIEEMDGNSWLFFDGSLSTTFTADMSDRLKEEYASQINLMLEKSEETHTPLIGYVDRSYAKDIARKFVTEVHDSYLLNKILGLLNYTQAFRAEEENICFSYLKANPGQPVRIEFPVWMEKLQHEVARVVFAECFLGSTKGYPYILERAHTCSKIDNIEKNDFRRAFSRNISFKWICKVK
ncbi:MAG TPA: DNA double-strand break repair nuclease NurA [Archaeoglobaceae archaeon]|nr:DNA double-strand break repair nuclease NurA [Archaeoglobaceae archaeon]